MPSLHEILVRKKLHPGIFDSVGFSIHLPIDVHIIRLYNDIYSRPYPNAGKHEVIARQIHGIQHVTRAAIYIPIFANLYRFFGIKEALALTNEDIKLLQIAALFHDSAREAEGEDHWDQESGLFFYEYVTNTLGLSPLKAKLFAEAIANKDADEANYFELQDMTWVKRESTSPKNIYQKLIHDADCLEIIRARDNFDAKYLDFYKDIAKFNVEAFYLMSKLITEAIGLIASQGDARFRLDLKIKAQYENRDAYRKMMDFITENKELYPLILTLSNNNLLIEEKLLAISEGPSSALEEKILLLQNYQNLIKDSDQLYSLLNQPLGKLNDVQREQIFRAIEVNLGNLIEDGRDLHDLLSLPLDKLNALNREKIWMAVLGQLDTLIKNPQQMYKLMGLSDLQLDASKKKKIIIDYQRYLDRLIVRLFGDSYCKTGNGRNGYEGMHGPIEYNQTLNILSGQPTGTYLLRYSLNQQGCLILAFVDQNGQVMQALISPEPSGNGRVICSNKVFSSIQSLILAYSIPAADGKDALLKKAVQYDESQDINLAMVALCIHDPIDYEQTRELLKGQPIGTYLLHYSNIEKEKIVLAFINSTGQIKQTYIELGPTGSKKVICSNITFSSLLSLIITYSNGKDALLKKAILPRPAKQEVLVTSSEVAAFTEESLNQILAKKKLNPLIFENNVGLILDAPIDCHIAWAYNNIYSITYPKAGKHDGIARQIHGIQHVTRAAINIPIFANLYRRFGNAEALALNNEDIKLLQIAALFHDSAREGEGVDLWDQDSGLFFYEYVTKTLGFSPLKAKLFAEAIANKDADEANYYELIDMAWVKREAKSPKNIYQKLIHDADCLEIIRARDHFDANYLDFYKDIAKSNDEAFTIMAKIITEARSLIASQGDSRLRLDFKIKAQYENRDVYRKIMDFITENKELYPLIITLSNTNCLIEEKLHEPLAISLSKEASTSISEESLTKAMYAGKLFARAVGSPAAYYKARKKEDEYTARLEIRKMTRVKGIPTRTSKPNRLEKDGNPNRSVTMLSHGVGIYASQGFLILNPNIDQISTASPIDFDTGRGKKSTIEIPEVSPAEKEEQLKAIHRKQKMGGTSRLFWHRYPTTHNEIIYRITEADAIYFTQDSTPHNEIMYGNDLPCNRHTHYLQALFLQIEYEKATGKKLPIFEYSGVHNFIKAAPIYTEDDIVAMWVEIVFKFIKKNIDYEGYCSDSLEALKIKAIDGYTGGNNLIKKQTALDLNYSPELQTKINVALEEASTKLLLDYEQKIIEGIKDGAQLSCLFDRPLEKLNIDQRSRIFRAVEVNLGTIIKNGTQLYYLLTLPLEKLNEEQRGHIFRAIETNLGALINDGDELCFLLELSFEKLKIEYRKLIFRAVEANLGTLINNVNQLLYLFGFSIKQLNDDERYRIFRAVEVNLGTIIKEGYQLFDLLDIPLEKLNDDQRCRIFSAIEFNLLALVDDGYQLRELLSLPLEKLNVLNRERIFRAVEANLGTLIKNESQISRLLDLPESKLSLKYKERITEAYKMSSRSIVAPTFKINDLILDIVEMPKATDDMQPLKFLYGQPGIVGYLHHIPEKEDVIVTPSSQTSALSAGMFKIRQSSSVESVDHKLGCRCCCIM